MLASLAPVGIVAVLASVLLSAWVASGPEARRDLEAVADLSTQPPAIVANYRYIEGHAEVARQVPCYCGCGRSLGHENLLDCYVIRRGVYSEHATGCKICTDEANDIERLAEAGASLVEIRMSIDASYAVYGAPTNTPPVKEAR
jgi:hypothetical protein